jgi:glycogen synthase
LKICLVSQEYPPESARGGIGSQTWNKARTLTSLGHSVHVLSCAGHPGPDPRTELCDGITVHRIQPPGSEFPVYNNPTYWVGYTWSVLRHLHRLMERVAFDVIDFAEYGAEGFAYQLDRTPWNWAPVVVQLHGPLAMFSERIGWPERDSDFYRLGTLMEDFCIKNADALMACSANIADFTAEHHGVSREMIEVVHCGVDAEAFNLNGRQERTEGEPRVLFVGNIAYNKGVNTVFEAVLRLRRKYPNIKLQILGKADGDEARAFNSRASAEGAAGNIEFCGFVGREQLPGFYRRADVFTSPAQHEVGVANVYLEAMACGCPVVASDTAGAPEAIVNDETGLLVPPNNVEAVAAALDRILSSSSLRARMGEAGRRRVEDYFAMDKYIQRVLMVYRNAIEVSQQKLSRLKFELGE